MFMTLSWALSALWSVVFVAQFAGFSELRLQPVQYLIAVVGSVLVLVLYHATGRRGGGFSFGVGFTNPLGKGRCSVEFFRHAAAIGNQNLQRLRMRRQS